jgi:GNAT superfamily N-acetyltransferase
MSRIHSKIYWLRHWDEMKFSLVNSNGIDVGSFDLDCAQENPWLDWFTIFPEFRGQKLSHECMEIIMDLCRFLGYKKLWLYVDFSADNAQRIYRKLGFEYLPQEDSLSYCYKMEKIL